MTLTTEFSDLLVRPRPAARAVPRPVRVLPPPPIVATARRFRPDIQGLRAIAVLLVVLYHARVPGLRAGYVGVDVFFVISGFLITGQLLREVADRGRINFANFYIKRIRRLLPAALLAVIVTVLVARWWAPALQVKSIAQDAIWTAIYGINFRLAHEGVDYLNTNGPVSPLQHFWSLAVEEQFYIFWPVLIGLCVLVGRRHRTTAVAVLLTAAVAASLFWSITTTSDNPSLAYFAIQTRAWELGLGGLVAVAAPVLARARPGLAAAGSWIGLLAVLASAFIYSDATVFPGSAALFPVGGATLFIAAGCHPGPVGAEPVLALRWVQWLGKVSYPWYVWHWPFIILAPMIAGQQSFSWLLNLEMLALALWIAALTHYGIEYPSLRGRLRRPLWLTVGAGLSVVTVVCSLLVMVSMPALVGRGHATTAVTIDAAATRQYTKQVLRLVRDSSRATAAPENLTPDLASAANDVPVTARNGCLAPFLATTQGPCVYGDPDGSRTMVLFGDSHADQWLPAFNVAAKRIGWKVVDWTKSACSAAHVTIENPQLKRPYTECSTWRDQTVQRVLDLHPDLIVVGQSDSVTGRAFTDAQWSDATLQTLGRFSAQKIPVAYILDTPYPTGDVPSCVTQQLNDVRACGRPNGTTWVTARHALLAKNLHDAGYATVEPRNWFCSKEYCPVIIGNMLVYRDASHMSATYSAWLAPLVQPILGERSDPAAARSDPASQRGRSKPASDVAEAGRAAVSP